MVEVFKTNITKSKQAKQVIEKLNRQFPSYQVNFDLEDCDNILRVESVDTSIEVRHLLEFIKSIGFKVSPLPDVCLTVMKISLKQTL